MKAVSLKAQRSTAGTSGQPLNLTRSAPWFLAALLLALVAFWPTYLSQVGAQSGYTHLHAATATLWILLLIAQPAALRAGRRDLHRMLGRASYVIAPLVVISIVLLAHQNMQPHEGERLLIQTYILYLQLSLALLFAACWVIAIWQRSNRPVHMRFMVLTAITFVDPVVIRLMFWVAPEPVWNYQWFTFGLTNALIMWLIWLDRHSAHGRWVFPAMLGIFILFQVPALFGLTFTAPWQHFAHWFAAL
jgi:hypothetical protein